MAPVVETSKFELPVPLRVIAVIALSPLLTILIVPILVTTDEFYITLPLKFDIVGTFSGVLAVILTLFTELLNSPSLTTRFIIYTPSLSGVNIGSDDVGFDIVATLEDGALDMLHKYVKVSESASELFEPFNVTFENVETLKSEPASATGTWFKFEGIEPPTDEIALFIAFCAS